MPERKATATKNKQKKRGDARMGVIVGVIKYLILAAIAGTMMYARGLYLELKETKAELKEAREIIKELKTDLREAYHQIEIGSKE